MTQTLSEHYPLYCTIQSSGAMSLATVTVPTPIVDTIYYRTALSQQHSTHTYGFQQGSVPLGYIEQNFRLMLLEHVKLFLFNYLVSSFLYQELRAKKLLIVGEPRLQDVYIEPHHDAHFTFALSTFPNFDMIEWKHLPFKAPKRKKYKDLDRQVESFIKTELQLLEQCTDTSAQESDWINFTITLVGENNEPLLGEYYEDLWFKIGDEEADKSLRETFLGKKVNDIFYTTNKTIQEYFSNQLEANHIFKITIIDILHNSFFCTDQFKRFFKLKTNKEMYQKLIEVFSYRNDLSQRRAMAEEAVKLLLSKHKFEVPTHMVLRQQKRVLDSVQTNPDYHVYRMQKDFKKRVRQLAEKQTKELILLDQIAYQDHITISQQDVKQFLNLTQRPRTKEFIYFETPNTKIRGQEIPLSSQELKLACLREKTLNHIIFHLTKA